MSFLFSSFALLVGSFLYPTFSPEGVSVGERLNPDSSSFGTGSLVWSSSPDWDVVLLTPRDIKIYSELMNIRKSLDLKDKELAGLRDISQKFDLRMEEVESGTSLLKEKLDRLQEKLSSLQDKSGIQAQQFRKDLDFLQQSEQSHGDSISSLQSDFARIRTDFDQYQENLSRCINRLQCGNDDQLRNIHNIQYEQNKKLAQIENLQDYLCAGLVAMIVLFLSGVGVALLMLNHRVKCIFQHLIKRRRVAWERLKCETLELTSQCMKSIQASSVSSPTDKPDHSPMLKFANEVARMEMNLNRMDPSSKGWKQLMKGLERIKNNFSASGYDMVPLLGQPYQEGLRADVDFVVDDKLPAGERRITFVTRPQVNYKGVIIQKSCITVSQNISH